MRTCIHHPTRQADPFSRVPLCDQCSTAPLQPLPVKPLHQGSAATRRSPAAHGSRPLGRALLLLSLFAVPSFAAEPCKVNVATCAAEQCAYLPGIGPAKGAAIEAAHPGDEAALDAVPGIGEATLAKIRPHVTYSGETTCTSKQASPKPETGKDGAQ